MAEVKFVRISKDAIIPNVVHEGDVGMDLTLINVHPSYTDQTSKVGHMVHKTILYGTGLKVIPPEGYYTEIVPRSNISKGPFRLANSIGIIDRGYNGELFIAVDKIQSIEYGITNTKLIEVKKNNDNKTILDTRFKNSFQLVLRPYIKPIVIEGIEEDIKKSTRGEGGFGSTNH